MQSYPGLGPKVRVSTEGGSRPRWNPNGRELFYDSGQAIWAVAVETEPRFVAGRPAPLVDIASLDWVQVSPDGQRFLAAVKFPEEDEQPLRLIYVPNWTEELKQAVSRGAS